MDFKKDHRKDRGRFAPSVIFQRLCRRILLVHGVRSRLRLLGWRLRGARVGRCTWLPPRVLATWPHQVQLGARCVLQPDVFFNYDHYWTPGPSMIFGDRVFIGQGTEFNIRGRLVVGDDCLIASGCTFIDADHGREPGTPMNRQEPLVAPIQLGNNVWIGARSIILKGVSIGDDAVIGAGSVVTRDVPSGETWAGVPARRILSPGSKE